MIYVICMYSKQELWQQRSALPTLLRGFCFNILIHYWQAPWSSRFYAGQPCFQKKTSNLCLPLFSCVFFLTTFLLVSWNPSFHISNVQTMFHFFPQIFGVLARQLKIMGQLTWFLYEKIREEVATNGVIPLLLSGACGKASSSLS